MASSETENTKHDEITVLMAGMTVHDEATCSQDNTLSGRKFMDIPLELRHFIYKELASAPRTIDVLELYKPKSKDRISDTDALSQLAQAHPKLKEEIQTWFQDLKRTELRQLLTGEIFDPASTTFLFAYERETLNDIVDDGNTRHWEQGSISQRTALCRTREDEVFIEAARHLIIDVSKSILTRLDWKLDQQSLLAKIMQDLYVWTGGFPNLERVDVFDEEEEFDDLCAHLGLASDDKPYSICWYDRLRLAYSYKPHCICSNAVVRELGRVQHKGPKPCTCCSVVDVRYGRDRGDPSERLIKI